MKRLLSLLLALSLLLLCGCGGKNTETEPSTIPTTAEPTTEATTEPTTVPTTEAPTEPPVPTNPLTGETLEAPLESRIFAVSINNIPAALPHCGVTEADVFFEMFVNDYCTRGLALYTDISQAGDIGSVRSLRYNFTDICQAYDAVVVHAGGSYQVLNDLYSTGVPNVSVESEAANYYYRNQSRINAGYAWEHTLFVKGPELVEYTANKGVAVTQDPEKDYGLHFTENAAPADGEDAVTISIDMVYSPVTKNTTMVYDAETGLYGYNEYGYELHDGITNQREGFKNVIVMFCDVRQNEVYHVANLLGGGEGYFACDGKIIPIQWHRDADSDPFTFTLTDGTPLEMGIGSSYISIAPLASQVTWE